MDIGFPSSNAWASERSKSERMNATGKKEKSLR